MNKPGAGRPRIPTQLHLLRGNPGKRALNHQEPKPKIEMPLCPAHLDDEARKEWRRIGRELVKLGLMTKIDRSALAAYCMLWSRWIEAEQELKKTGTIVKAKNGFPVLSPYLIVANKALEQMRVFLTEFGLTPASRSRIHAQPPKDDGKENKLQRFLNKA